MEITKANVEEFAQIVASAVVTALKDAEKVVKPTVQYPTPPKRTAYQKTEQLLYNYNGFKRIVKERMEEIEDIRKYGVPQRGVTIGERVKTSPVQTGIVLPEESVEAAVHNVQASVQGTMQVISLIDKSMAALKSDPYYKILEMRYFEGRTQEDIAQAFGCSQFTISTNKTRLVKELSMRIFPNQAVEEMMN